MIDDASKPLKNRKHELFARALAKNPTEPQSKAYKEVYPGVTDESATVRASTVLSNVSVRDRMLHLLSASAKRPILEKVSDKINEHMDGDNAPVSMDACKTILKVAGAMDEAERKESSFNPTQIIINIMPDKDNDSI